MVLTCESTFRVTRVCSLFIFGDSPFCNAVRLDQGLDRRYQIYVFKTTYGIEGFDRDIKKTTHNRTRGRSWTLVKERCKLHVTK